ncbi:MAG: type transport system permease protein [Thermomicrobiales bacterium]|jgi:ABC-2 type transport system permease protein|nr:type transport system permease protein [Thermomicrobiales bacterium]MEA2526939.1 type transport system permease protein [Thermomicrobiales bacterium]
MVAPEQTMPVGAAAQPARYGEIYDRGYQHYDGPRLGRRHAFSALVRYSMKRALGIKKGWTSKVVPILLYVAVALVVVIPLGVEAFLPSASVLEYWDFFGFIFLIQGIFVATIAPEMLCGDRRENVLSLYFSRAITRLDYLLAKLVAASILTLTISLVPVVIYWLGRQFLDDKPMTAIKNNVDDLGRLVICGSLIAAYLGALGLAISSFTGRKSIAVAIIIVGFVVSTSLAYAMAAAIDSEISRYFVLLSPADTIGMLSYRIFEQPIFPDDFGEALPLWEILAGIVGIVVLSCGVMYWRYVPNE